MTVDYGYLVEQALRDASARWKAGDDPAPRQPAQLMNVVIPKLSLNRPRNGIVRTPRGEPLPGSVVYDRASRSAASRGREPG